MVEESKAFTPFDLTKVMGELDPKRIMDQFTKVMGTYQLPQLDISQVMESHRKNVEALINANKQALQGVEAVAARQNEILRQTMDEAMAVIKDLAGAGTPTERAEKQAQVLRDALGKALGHMRELAEISAKSNAEAFATINERITDSINEIKALASKMPAKE